MPYEVRGVTVTFLAERIEIRDGREFKVTTLPDALPPKNRSKKTRYHFEDVARPGDSNAGAASRALRRKKRRKKS